VSDPYPFESEDDIEIRELDLESVDAVDDERITVGDLVGENESWRYGHVIVDEAQDLTPMQWRMVMRRVRGRSLTIVGDLAQRSGDTARNWTDLLPAELADAQRQDLTVNYRSPAEIHELAVAVLAGFAPNVVPSRAIRRAGSAPRFEPVDDIEAALAGFVSELGVEVGGQIAVITVDAGCLHQRLGGELAALDAELVERLRILEPNEAKGLEFDAVVLVEPTAIWERHGGPAQLYIALTRATRRLIVVHNTPLPPVLTPL
jgi:superfamily I DNA/RNA helicase